MGDIQTDFSRRIVREDCKYINVNYIISQKEYNEKLTNELQKGNEKDEMYEVKDEMNVIRPTSTIATLATETSVPLTPHIPEIP